MRIRYDSPEQAAAAQLDKLELPPGRRIAFSTRWDDSVEHGRMVDALRANGYSGTFYINRANADYAGRDDPAMPTTTPAWKAGVIRRDVAALAPGATSRFEVELGGADGDMPHDDDPCTFAAQIDWNQGANARRIHALVSAPASALR